jgi:two-component system, cell cycle sensor histidine kinase DivJ
LGHSSSLESRSASLIWAPIRVNRLVAALAVAAFALTGALGVFGAASGPVDLAFFVVPAMASATFAATVLMRRKSSSWRLARLQAERFGILTETMGDVVVTHDRSGATTSVSRNCEALFGLPATQLMGRGFFERVHVADRPAFLNAIAEACAGTETVNTTLRLRTSGLVDRGPYAEPVFLWLDMRARRCGEQSVGAGDAAKLQGARGPGAGGQHAKGNGAIAVLRNISEAKWRQDELESAKARAEEASLSKDHFLANMSHELRTPLNAIIGFSEILGNPELTPDDPAKQREYAAIIHQSGQHLISVVNSILDLSKIQAGAFELTAAPFALAPLIDCCCDMVQLKAGERGIAVARHCPEGLDEVIGDRRAFKQILINLLSNSVKFTPANGKVSISARVEGKSLMLVVADSGVGIQAQDLARIGSPFFQAKGSLDRPYEGTGLGLSIVRGLVGLHGGSIAVASEPDQGTCVLVRLPMDCRAADAARTCASIETIARYRRDDEQCDFLQQITVKKIA